MQYVLLVLLKYLILSEAKDLILFTCTKDKILRFAQDDSFIARLTSRDAPCSAAA